MSTQRGLPRVYYKDLKDDKALLFDAVDTVKDCLLFGNGLWGNHNSEAQS